MTLEIFIHEHHLMSFEFEEPDLPGWDNCEARIKTRDYYIDQFRNDKDPILRNLKNTIFYLVFKSKVHEIPIPD